MEIIMAVNYVHPGRVTRTRQNNERRSTPVSLDKGTPTTYVKG